MLFVDIFIIMNLTSIDSFLFLKAQKTIDAYFDYLNKGFEIIDIEKKEIPKEKEHLIKEYFGRENIEYQVATTTFVSEVFHVIETYLKSNLLRVGDYLLYPSIDKYPESKEKLNSFNQTQKAEITKILIDFTQAISKKKENKMEEISKRIGHLLFNEEKQIIVNSISCSEALYRVEKFLQWNVSIETKERFKLFIENRNEIIHFNKLSNLTFTAAHSLFVLNTFATTNPIVYPQFCKINEYLGERLELFNILNQEILFNIDRFKVLQNLKENVAILTEKVTSLPK